MHTTTPQRFWAPSSDDYMKRNHETFDSHYMDWLLSAGSRFALYADEKTLPNDEGWRLEFP